MKKVRLVLISLLMFFAVTGCSNEDKNLLDKDDPTTIQVWHYYNGAQQEEFNRLVDEFNKTVGKEKGIIVEGSGQGTISDLERNVLDSINGKAGAADIPNIFAAYGDTVYQVDKLGYAVDLNKYFSKDELSKYVDGYLEEGHFSSKDTLKIFPVAKSVELFMLNKTDWEKFANATGASTNDLNTIEGVTKVAEQYYNWTDSLTAAPNDGKAFFGRDAFANYMLVGYRQLATDIFSKKDNKIVLNFEADIAKKLWDNYYVPYISGYFSSSGKFRSDDIKIGNILACVSSSSSVTYFPKEVILNDEESHSIELETFACPKFKDGKDYVVQQGAGMVVLKSEEKEQQAAVEFLKWFTSDKQNIAFSNASGYLPVTKSANDLDKITDEVEVNESVKKTLNTSLKMISDNNMYTSVPFEKGTDARNVLETTMSNLAKQDRETVITNLSNGMNLEQAISQFNNDTYFNQWYTNTKSQLESLIK